MTESGAEKELRGHADQRVGIGFDNGHVRIRVTSVDIDDGDVLGEQPAGHGGIGNIGDGAFDGRRLQPRRKGAGERPFVRQDQNVGPIFEILRDTAAYAAPETPGSIDQQRDPMFLIIRHVSP